MWTKPASRKGNKYLFQCSLSCILCAEDGFQYFLITDRQNRLLNPALRMRSRGVIIIVLQSYNRAGGNAKDTHLKPPIGVHIFAKRTPPIKILGTDNIAVAGISLAQICLITCMQTNSVTP